MVGGGDGVRVVCEEGLILWFAHHSTSTRIGDGSLAEQLTPSMRAET